MGVDTHSTDEDGSNSAAHGMLYKAAAHTVLIHGSESWVVTGEILKVVEEFHHKAYRRITGMVDRRAEDKEWEYPPVADTMKFAGL